MSDASCSCDRSSPSFTGDMVIWMVVAMVFFRNEPITDVVRRLNLSADGEAGMNLLARSAVTQARQRVGAAPVEWLFRQTAQTWGAERYLHRTGIRTAANRNLL
ncbi:transposase domain-containing protein [Escherichia coli]|uniref:transposase domain-containing protein n=1 Tax=Escherichia coli TaxID=562 RepID=UPI0032AF0AF0